MNLSPGMFTFSNNSPKCVGFDAPVKFDNKDAAMAHISRVVRLQPGNAVIIQPDNDDEPVEGIFKGLLGDSAEVYVYNQSTQTLDLVWCHVASLNFR